MHGQLHHRAAEDLVADDADHRTGRAANEAAEHHLHKQRLLHHHRPDLDRFGTSKLATDLSGHSRHVELAESEKAQLIRRRALDDKPARPGVEDHVACLRTVYARLNQHVPAARMPRLHCGWQPWEEGGVLWEKRCEGDGVAERSCGGVQGRAQLHGGSQVRVLPPRRALVHHFSRVRQSPTQLRPPLVPPSLSVPTQRLLHLHRLPRERAQAEPRHHLSVEEAEAQSEAPLLVALRRRWQHAGLQLAAHRGVQPIAGAHPGRQQQRLVVVELQKPTHPIVVHLPAIRALPAVMPPPKIHMAAHNLLDKGAVRP
mmetsp:Transcript_221/g.382  ORF Transcript_221/g.382 Transcript_221/m.382 type:complete len:314 (+) Transcript_221:561-1502(+)